VRRAWLVALVAAVALVAGGAAPALEGGNPADTDPAWSPDGRWIAFVHAADSGYNGSSRDLVLAEPTAGGSQRVLARGTELGSNQPYDPRWSPDGTKLLFGACCDPDEIWTVAADGSALTRLTTVGREPTWSPDGRRVAYVGERSYLSVMNADGSDQQRLAPAASHPAWSPDGTKIAYTSGDDLYVWLLRDGRSEALMHTRRKEDNARWSPDGRLISFTRGFDYYVMGADGSAQRRVARAQQDDPSLSPPGPAVWSPDGRWLAVAARAPVARPVGLVADTIQIVRPDGSGLRRLTHLTHSSQAQPSWSPGGRAIAFDASPPCPGIERWGIATVSVLRQRMRWVTQNCFIYGSAGPDTLVGTANAEVIYGFGGNDVILGGASEDVLQGGRGNDRLDGGRTYDDICDEWCDILRGGPGNDVLVAHDTPSFLDGGLGRDRLIGSSRSDLLDGGRGPDVIRAGRGDDVVHAQDGVADVIACGPGHDAVAADRVDRVARDCEYVRRR
jgi:Tol biopolymer transport system component